MSEDPTVLYEKQDELAVITFNRPDSLNAYNEDMLATMKDCLIQAKEDEEIKLILVKGAGRAFSAGVDLKSTSAEDFQSGAPFMKLGFDVGQIITTMPKVTIAQVHGYCFTGALEIMLFFDLAFCSDSTQFGDTHAKWGIMPRWGMTQRLARRVGLAKAKELTFRAYRVKGPEAERIGMVNRSFEDERLEDEVKKIITEILANDHESMMAIKTLYDEGYAITFAEGLRLEQNADTQIEGTSDNLNQFEKKKFTN